MSLFAPHMPFRGAQCSTTWTAEVICVPLHRLDMPTCEHHHRYLAMHAKFNHVEGCVTAVRAVCKYIEAQVKQPPFRQTKSLHTTILAAYNCITYVRFATVLEFILPLSSTFAAAHFHSLPFSRTLSTLFRAPSSLGTPLL